MRVPKYKRLLDYRYCMSYNEVPHYDLLELLLCLQTLRLRSVDRTRACATGSRTAIYPH